ncbi:MAG: hypothetical protein CMC14_06665 [Flavobacteriaceae bacterium]|mgnify:FL=1|nr:hypothetical protein [Flavobacteriaceae bacterium]
MKYYYYIFNDQRLGPFTLEELKIRRLKKSTLVWVEGMEDWVSADSINELKEILISEPPPLPNKRGVPQSIKNVNINQVPRPKSSNTYDLTYKKETDATFFGILLIVLPIINGITKTITFEKIESYYLGTAIIAIILFVLRVLVTVWVVNIANRQNRNTTVWGWFAFLLPSIALIIIGLLKKQKLKISINGTLPINEQIEILHRKAYNFYKDGRFKECIELMNTALDKDNNNYSCMILRAKSFYKSKRYIDSKNEFNELISKEKFISESFYYLGNIEMAFSNRHLAIENWLKSKSEGYAKADVKLDLYHSFTNKFFLEKPEIKRKLGEKNENILIPYGSFIYINGLSKFMNETIVEISLFENGIDFEFRKIFKTTHVAIAFYEIKEIKNLDNENLFELVLFENKPLLFKYNKSKDLGNKFETFCAKLKENL